MCSLGFFETLAQAAHVFLDLIRLGLNLSVGRNSRVLGVRWLNLGPISSYVGFWQSRRFQPSEPWDTLLKDAFGRVAPRSQPW